jgi:MoxR-like ATPase
VKPSIAPILKAEDILQARELISQIYIDDKIKKYIVDLIFATRDPARYKLDLLHLIRCGASPRASINLALCARVYAFLQGRAYVLPCLTSPYQFDL